MKLNKIFAFALAAMTLTSCCDEDEINTADVTVSMGEETITMPEDQISSASFYEIPIVVEGEANGPITVTVEFTSTGENGAKAGENYIVTSETIIIPEGKSEGHIELYPKGDEVTNEDRQFTATIVKATGAEIGTQASTLVTLLDNEGMVINAYESIQGVWTMSVETDEGPYSYDVEIVGDVEGGENYLKKLTIYGIEGQADWQIEATMSCNPVNGETILNFETGEKQLMGSANFESIGLCDVYLYTIDGDGYLSTLGTSATGNKDLTQITFHDTLAGIFVYQGKYYATFIYNSAIMTR